MRIAVSGAHAVGKSTLVAELAARLPDHELHDEPYYDLVDEGVVFSVDPSPEDFVSQLERSCMLLALHQGPNVIFDRCPVDYLAYLSVLDASPGETLSYWLRRVAESMANLDLLVFVPIERPDRIQPAGEDQPALRKRVDRALREILMEDSLGLDLDVVEVNGPVSARVQEVLERARHA